MLAALAERLENNEEMERTVAATELRTITRLRVAKELVMTVSTHVLDAAGGTPAPGVSVALSMRDADGSWLIGREGRHRR